MDLDSYPKSKKEPLQGLPKEVASFYLCILTATYIFKMTSECMGPDDLYLDKKPTSFLLPLQDSHDVHVFAK